MCPRGQPHSHVADDKMKAVECTQHKIGRGSDFFFFSGAGDSCCPIPVSARAWGMRARRLSLLIPLFLLIPPLAVVPSLAQQNPAPAAAVRACKADLGSSAGVRGSTKGRKKKAEDKPTDAANACLEVRFLPLDIQEYLQTYVREQQWKISKEHVGEQTLIFSRELNKDELLGYTKHDNGWDRIIWSGGSALIQLQTTELEGGYTRATIAARFQGYGENRDKFAMPREFWPLESNGTLETSLSAALEKHFTTLH